MIAAVILLSKPRTWIEDSRRRYVDEDGELWTYYALCIKCNHLFAIPEKALFAASA